MLHLRAPRLWLVSPTQPTESRPCRGVHDMGTGGHAALLPPACLSVSPLRLLISEGPAGWPDTSTRAAQGASGEAEAAGPSNVLPPGGNRVTRGFPQSRGSVLPSPPQTPQGSRNDLSGRKYLFVQSNFKNLCSNESIGLFFKETYFYSFF